jgi:hypothetical protein
LRLDRDEDRHKMQKGVEYISKGVILVVGNSSSSGSGGGGGGGDGRLAQNRLRSINSRALCLEGRTRTIKAK